MNKIDRNKIKELFHAGKGDKEISKILNCKADTIKHIRMKELKIKRRERKIYSENIKKHAVKLIEDGLSYYELSRKFGITYPTIKRWCEESDVKSIYKSGESRFRFKKEIGIFDPLLFKKKLKYRGFIDFKINEGSIITVKKTIKNENDIIINFVENDDIKSFIEKINIVYPNNFFTADDTESCIGFIDTIHLPNVKTVCFIKINIDRILRIMSEHFSHYKFYEKHNISYIAVRKMKE